MARAHHPPLEIFAAHCRLGFRRTHSIENRLLPPLLCRQVLWFLTAFIAGAFATHGQPPGAPPGLNQILTRVLHSAPPFSALADVHILSPNEAESMRMPMEFKFLEGNIRTEINMAQVQSPALRQEMVVNLREIGMDQVVTIGRTGPSPMLIIYPQLKAYVEFASSNLVSAPALDPKDAPPQSPPAPSSASKPPRKRLLDNERVDDHPCQRFNLSIEDAAGGKAQEVMVWEAQDLNGLPVQIEMIQPEFRIRVLFRGVQFKRPDPKDFAVPPEFTKYESMEKVMEKAVNRLLGDPATKKPGAAEK